MLLAACAWIGAARAEESPAELRQRIESMSPAEKEQLRQREERFHNLPPAEQQRIVKLHEDLKQASDGAKLHEVMRRYYQWLKTLPSYRRAELFGLDPKERVGRIQELREEQAKIEARRLNPKDAEELLKWMEEYAKKQESRFLGTLRPEDRERFDRQSDPKSRSRELMWWSWQRWQMGSPGRLPPLEDADLADLRSKLSAETRKRLEDLPPEEQRRTIASWISHERRNHWASRRPQGKSAPTDEELLSFFETELSDRDRDRLLSLPGDELQKELRDMYVIRRRPLEPPRPGEGPGPGHFRGPGPPGGYFRGPDQQPPDMEPGLPPPPPPGRGRPPELPPPFPPANERDSAVPPSAPEKTRSDPR